MIMKIACSKLAVRMSISKADPRQMVLMMPITSFFSVDYTLSVVAYQQPAQICDNVNIHQILHSLLFNNYPIIYSNKFNIARLTVLQLLNKTEPLVLIRLIKLQTIVIESIESVCKNVYLILKLYRSDFWSKLFIPYSLLDQTFIETNKTEYNLHIFVLIFWLKFRNLGQWIFNGFSRMIYKYYFYLLALLQAIDTASRIIIVICMTITRLSHGV